LKKTGESQAKKQKLEKTQQAEKAKQALSMKKHKQELQRQVQESKNLEKKVLTAKKPASILTKNGVIKPSTDPMIKKPTLVRKAVADKVAAEKAKQLSRDLKM